MKDILNNKKYGILKINNFKDWCWIPRCWWKKGRKKKSPRVLIKCGDCNNKVEIYYDKNEEWGIEINGVMASNEWWRELFKEIGLIK